MKTLAKKKENEAKTIICLALKSKAVYEKQQRYKTDHISCVMTFFF